MRRRVVRTLDRREGCGTASVYTLRSSVRLERPRRLMAGGNRWPSRPDRYHAGGPFSTLTVLRRPPTKSCLSGVSTMRCSLSPHPHDIYPTSLDPPESTLHPPRRRSRRPGQGFPFAEPTGGFHLVPDENTPRVSTPGPDPKDDPLGKNTISGRSTGKPNMLAGIHFRHHTWNLNRVRVLEALLDDDPNKLAWIDFDDDPNLPDVAPRPAPSERSRRFIACGTRSIVLQSADDPKRYKIGCERCHDRFCLPCMQDRARLIVANLKAQLKYEPTRFLTLTLKHTDAPLREQLDRLYASFVTLRRRAFWQEAVTGGVAFLELKLSSADDAWHPHLHVLLRGKYLAQRLIADAWLQITGDSFIVDIRMAGSPEHLYSYLTRYITKGWDTGIYRTLHKLREAISALKGRKLLSSFGDFSSLRLLAPPTSETWVELGTLREVLTLAAARCAWAMAACVVIFSPSYEPPACVEPPDD